MFASSCIDMISFLYFVLSDVISKHFSSVVTNRVGLELVYGRARYFSRVVSIKYHVDHSLLVGTCACADGFFLVAATLYLRDKTPVSVLSLLAIALLVESSARRSQHLIKGSLVFELRNFFTKLYTRP